MFRIVGLFGGLASLLVAASAGSVIATQGDLDPTYAIAGVARIDAGSDPVNPRLHQLILQPDGGVLAVTDVGGYGPRRAMLRWTSAGTPDPAWNGGPPLSPTEDAVVRRAPDGSYYWAEGVVLRRVDANGSPDATFGVNGATSVPGQATIFDVLPLDNGSVAVSGKAYSQFAWRSFITRLLPSGDIDSTFGTNGTWLSSDTAPWGSGVQRLRSGASGEIWAVTGGAADSSLSLISATGQLVTGFGTGGTLMLTTEWGSMECVTVDSSGRPLIIDGATTTGPSAHFTITRLLRATGQTDTSFAAAGTGSISVPDAAHIDRCDLITSPSSDVVYLAYSVGPTSSPPQSLTAARLDTGIALATFGTGGTIPLAAVGNTTSAIAASADGVVVATTSGEPLVGPVSLRRFTTTGTAKTAFAGGTVAATVDVHRREYVAKMVPDADGNTLVMTTNHYGSFRVGRLGPDGSPVPPATSTTLFSVSIPSNPAQTSVTPIDVVALPDGRIAVTYFRSEGSNNPSEYLEVFNSDGSTDTTFGTDGRLAVTRTAVRVGGARQETWLYLAEQTWRIGVGYDLTVERRSLTTGAIDTAYGVNGTATLTGTSTNFLWDFQVDATGGVIWAQRPDYEDGAPGVSAFVKVARLSPAGTPDATFGNGGVAYITTPNQDAAGTWLSTTVLPDGSIMVIGRGDAQIPDVPTVSAVAVKLTQSGQLDPSFGSGGIAATPVSLGPVSGYVDQHGVTFATLDSTSRRVELLRFDPDGHLDELLGVGGRTSTALPPSDFAPYAKVAPAGDSVLVGSSVVSVPTTHELPGTDAAVALVTATGKTFAAKPRLSTPMRVLDTRPGAATADGQSAGIGKRPALTTTEVQVAGRLQVPVGIEAVVLNITVVQPEAGGYVTAAPCGGAVPLASSLNYAAGQVVANEVIVRVPTTGTTRGRVCLTNSSGTHLIADLIGYFPAGTSYGPLTPARLADTRPSGTTIDGQGPTARLTAGSVTEVQMVGRGGVVDDAPAVVINVTAVKPSSTGFLTVFPCGNDRPLSSTLNFTAGRTVANEVVATLPTTGPKAGKVCVFASADTDLLIDAVGFMPSGSAYEPHAPARLLDTRANGHTVDGMSEAEGALSSGVVYQLQVAGRGGVPDDATIAVLNVTVTGAPAGGWVVAFSCDFGTPLASTLNLAPGRAVANETIVQLGAIGPNAGKVCIYTSALTHVIVDVSGDYAV